MEETTQIETMEEKNEVEEMLVTVEKYEKSVLKPARRHLSYLGGIFVLGAVLIYVAQLFLALAARGFAPELFANADISLLLFSVLPIYFVGMPVIILLVKRIPAEAPRKHKMKAGHYILAIIMMFGAAYLCNIVGNILTFFIGLLKGGTVENTLSEATSSLSLWTILFYMVICAPFMEEYVFRKLIVDRAVRYGQGIAVVLSGLMFGLFHGNLNQFAYAFTVGMFFAFLYVKTGKLKITIGLHMTMNLVGGFASWLASQAVTDFNFSTALASDRAALDYLIENLWIWLAFLCLGIFVIAMVITGSILFLVALVKKKFTLEKGTVVVPKSTRFSTAILNPGMLLYCLFWMGMIFLQLFS